MYRTLKSYNTNTNETPNTKIQENTNNTNIPQNTTEYQKYPTIKNTNKLPNTKHTKMQITKINKIPINYKYTKYKNTNKLPKNTKIIP